MYTHKYKLALSHDKCELSNPQAFFNKCKATDEPTKRWVLDRLHDIVDYHAPFVKVLLMVQLPLLEKFNEAGFGLKSPKKQVKMLRKNYKKLEEYNNILTKLEERKMKILVDFHTDVKYLINYCNEIYL